jgi:hypothetical protein
LTQGENVTLRKQLKEAHELLHSRKVRKRGKRVALSGRFVFSTDEVLKLAEEAEAETAGRRKAGRQPQNRKATSSVEEKEAEALTEVSSDSDSDCIVVGVRN